MACLIEEQKQGLKGRHQGSLPFLKSHLLPHKNSQPVLTGSALICTLSSTPILPLTHHSPFTRYPLSPIMTYPTLTPLRNWATASRGPSPSETKEEDIVPAQALPPQIRNDVPPLAPSVSVKRSLSFASRTGPDSSKKLRQEGRDDFNEAERTARPLPTRASRVKIEHTDDRASHSEAPSNSLQQINSSPTVSNTWLEAFIAECGVAAASPDCAGLDIGAEAPPHQYHPPSPPDSPLLSSLPSSSPSPSPSPSPYNFPSQLEGGHPFYASQLPFHAPQPLFYPPQPSLYSSRPALYAPQPVYPVGLLAQDPPRLLSPIHLSSSVSTPSPRPDTPFRGQLDFLLELLRNETYFEALKGATRRSPPLVEMLQEVIEDSESSSQERVGAVECFKLLASARRPRFCVPGL
ncbi:hypothetical protein BKA70DRAFT_1398135 [Coprinopsis sp. MPI-PUGE-AT-0042]|nr:hypothetical protein BKA70DRAFT_1398135 [Coprinopsis sp. MPI-PUGE-AT-0042]